MRHRHDFEYIRNEITKISKDVVYLIYCSSPLYIYDNDDVITGATSVSRPIMLVREFVILITIIHILYGVYLCAYIYVYIINYTTVSPLWSSWWRTPNNLGWSTAAEFHRSDSHKFTNNLYKTTIINNNNIITIYYIIFVIIAIVKYDTDRNVSDYKNR